MLVLHDAEAGGESVRSGEIVLILSSTILNVVIFSSAILKRFSSSDI